ncbi:MAG: hypothetical protein NZ954_04195 [Thermofilaceae archaeon]|nr:hypothetical protein [Thermofilaceae archaeon]MCX8180058.1 hypothetical protein [Thermofilaceae archaeon]MDW8003200.1 hypothetical protein [Thermofilaceae archaeon]
MTGRQPLKRSRRTKDSLLEEVIERLKRIERRLQILEENLANDNLDRENNLLAAQTLALALKLVKAGGIAVDLTWTATRLAKLQPLLSRQRDELSRSILEVVALKGPINISALTDQLRRYRGSASRRIVASRVKKMVEEGLLSIKEKGREKVVDLPG